MNSSGTSTVSDPPTVKRPGVSLNWSAIGRDASTLNWSVTNFRSALLCLPVIAAWVFIGMISNRHEGALLAVAGSVAVAFGAFQPLANRRVCLMAVTLAGICL